MVRIRIYRIAQIIARPKENTLEPFGYTNLFGQNITEFLDVSPVTYHC